MERTAVRKMGSVLVGLLSLSGFARSAEVARESADGRAAFREVFEELVETDTSVSTGDCTIAAARAHARLKAAGFGDDALITFGDTGHPKEGGLVALIKGADSKAGAVLLLGHLDVVEARREDWSRDPFKLVEAGGYFYGRGVADMKGLDAIWIDTLVRLKLSGARPRKTLKMALTCGEETAEAFNGAGWLVRNRSDLIAADFALNEGGGGQLDPSGARRLLFIQVGEKAAQSYLLTVLNPGGHSSHPRPDNAIYQLAEALLKVRASNFPVRLSNTTRVGLELRARKDDPVGRALKSLLTDPSDEQAARTAETDANMNAILHTTCVATLLDAGHAANALPQRATATVNCRIFPGESVAETRATLEKAIGDPGVSIETLAPIRPIALDPPWDPKILGPMKQLGAVHFPGVPMIPTMSAGATDARYLGLANIPVYGVPGLFTEPDGGGIHGRNERIRVDVLYAGRDYLFDLVKAYIDVD